MSGTLKRPAVWTCFICAYKPDAGPLYGGAPRWFVCAECLGAAARLGLYDNLVDIVVAIASAMDFSEHEPVVQVTPPSVSSQCFICGWGFLRGSGVRPVWIICDDCLEAAGRLGVHSDLVGLEIILIDEQGLL